MVDCIFCKIIVGKIPCEKLYEDKNTFAFLDANPGSLGHSLVIPKKHYETLDKLKKEDLKPLMEAIHKISKAIDSFSKGYNIIQNNKPVAGQVVPHVHFHIIPRKSNDGISWERPEPKFSKTQIKDIQEKIKTLLK